MKIVHIQTGIKANGNSVYRLHSAMLKAGIDSYILCAITNVLEDRIISFNKYQLKLFAIKNLLSALLVNRVIERNYSYPIFNQNLIRYKIVRTADIIYIHWTQGGLLNIKGIRKILKLGKPVVFSCRDFWYVTGGCHSPLDCEKYKSQCYDCIFLKSNKKNDLAFKLFRKKMRLYLEFNNIYFLVPSTWMLDKTRISALASQKRFFCIPNVLDRTTFYPFERKLARLDLGLALDKTYLLFGSVKPTSNKNKGWDLLEDSLQQLNKLSKMKIEFLIFGSDGDDANINNLPFKTNFLGIINDDSFLAKVYSASDVFLSTSLSESFGNVILESLSCGTAVVSFNIGGAADMIEHRKSGYLAKYGNSKDFTEGILYCIEKGLKGFLPDEMATGSVIEKHKEMIKTIALK